MVAINSIEITPPLLNSSCAWSSDLRDLQELHDSPYTGALTTRTATLDGFKEDVTHTVAFSNTSTSTLNSYGYSPHPLSDYVGWVEQILRSSSSKKPIIISITASAAESLRSMVSSIQELRTKLSDGTGASYSRVAIELNTSCPNIRDASPSGYSFTSLKPLLDILAREFEADHTLTIGLKLPPFVFKEQFLAVLEVLQSLVVAHPGSKPISPISFLTCTNTLGNSLLFADQALPSGEGNASQFAVPTALGGLAGDSLHALALGNVYTFSRLIHGQEARFPALADVKIIGVGGVTSKLAAERMVKAGADAVACATLYGKEGIKAFEILTVG